MTKSFNKTKMGNLWAPGKILLPSQESLLAHVSPSTTDFLMLMVEGPRFTLARK